MSLPQVVVQIPKDLGPRVWGRELLVADGPGYIGKVLEMRAGTAGGCQVHLEKDETSYLLSGSAWLYTDTGDGALTRFLLSPGTSVHIPPGAVHKVEAITDCMFFEASTPHFHDRVRVDARYGLDASVGLPSTKRLDYLG